MMMNRDNILHIIERYHSQISSKEKTRAIGVLEGILLEKGVLHPGIQFEYREIAYICKPFVGRAIVKTRLQTYEEHIIELAKMLTYEEI